MRSARPSNPGRSRRSRLTLRITQRCSYGGVVSPLLLNIALHGMEMAAGVRYYQTGNSAGKAVMGSPVLIRYADLCGDPHRSAYAESLVMPSLGRDRLCLLGSVADSSA